MKSIVIAKLLILIGLIGFLSACGDSDAEHSVGSDQLDESSSTGANPDGSDHAEEDGASSTSYEIHEIPSGHSGTNYAGGYYVEGIKPGYGCCCQTACNCTTEDDGIEEGLQHEDEPEQGDEPAVDEEPESCLDDSLFQINLIEGSPKVEFKFDLCGIKSAFIQVPTSTQDYVDAIPLDRNSDDQFKGGNAYPFKDKAAPVWDYYEESLNALLDWSESEAASPESTVDVLPLNYCRILSTKASSTAKNLANYHRSLCHDTGTIPANYAAGQPSYNYMIVDGHWVMLNSYNYANIMIPTNAEGQASGTWDLMAPASNNVFQIFYRDMENKQHVKKFAVDK